MTTIDVNIPLDLFSVTVPEEKTGTPTYLATDDFLVTENDDFLVTENDDFLVATGIYIYPYDVFVASDQFSVTIPVEVA